MVELIKEFASNKYNIKINLEGVKNIKGFEI